MDGTPEEISSEGRPPFDSQNYNPFLAIHILTIVEPPYNILESKEVDKTDSEVVEGHTVIEVDKTQSCTLQQLMI